MSQCTKIYFDTEVLVCIFGCVGFINTLLSWSAFVPLSRLTYAAYLVHPMLMLWYYCNLTTLIYVSSITMVMQSLSQCL